MTTTKFFDHKYDPEAPVSIYGPVYNDFLAVQYDAMAALPELRKMENHNERLALASCIRECVKRLEHIAAVLEMERP